MRGGLTPVITADARGVEFRDAAGATVLTYAGLKVWDADGKPLASRFVTVASGLRLLVEECGARYPLTIDPIAQQAYLKPSAIGPTQAGDWFGNSVAASGDTVVIGAQLEDSSTMGVNSTPDEGGADSGAAYIFTGLGPSLTALQIWRQQYFGAASNSDNAADGFDFDGDGLVNFLEWVCNLDPTLPSTLPVAIVRNGANLEFTYTRSVTAVNAGVAFTVEWRDTLEPPNWSTSGVSETIPFDDGTVQQVKALVPAGSGPRFVHLKVTGPP